MDMNDWENNEEIKLFREYIRIPTVNPVENYDDCVKFFTRQAEAIELPIEVYYPASKPMIVLKWIGTEPNLPAILLYSHMDVVPVYREHWIHDPFGAEMDSDGKIYGRGTQDMKSVGIQHLAAVKAMKNAGIRLKRNVLIMYGADEEVFGIDGMQPFVETQEFRNLNIGYALDEGVSKTENEFGLVYNEKQSWHLNIKCSGAGGHGMLLIKNTAGEKLRFLLDKIMDFRASEAKKLKDNPELTLGRITTVNVTSLKGGVQNNVVPPEFTIFLDIRVGIDTNQSKLEEIVAGWCKEAGDSVEIIFSEKGPPNKPISLDDNILYQTVKTAVEEMGFVVKPEIASGGTDSRFLRGKGIIAIGFSPMNNTPKLIHDHNEYLKADTFFKRD